MGATGENALELVTGAKVKEVEAAAVWAPASELEDAVGEPVVWTMVPTEELAMEVLAGQLVTVGAQLVMVKMSVE